MARGRAKAKPEPLARGGAKAKPRLRAVAKTRATRKAKAAERGPAPRLLRSSWTLCLKPPTSCTSRVAATTRAALAGTPGSATTSGTTVRCEPSSVNGWGQRRAHSAASARLQPSSTGESASATPHRQPPTPPKAPPRDQQGRKLEPGPMPRQRRLRVEEGHPLPLGTLTSPPLRQQRRRTRLGRARPPHGRVGLLAKQRQPGVLHSRLRSTSPRRRLPLRHGSRKQWRPGAYRLPCQSGSGPPPHVAPAREASRLCQRLRLPSPLFPWVAWRRQPWRLTQSRPRPSSCFRCSGPGLGPGRHASCCLSPTSPAEPAKEGGGAATPGAVASTPPATAPAVPVPEGEPRLLRLDVSCQVGTHLVVLRMAMTANSTISSLISKARERASAPGLTVASLHGSPDVELPHAATLGAVLPQGELRLLLREGPSTAAPSGANLAQGAAPSLFSPDQCWCYCCGIGTGSPLLMQAHAMTDRHVWNARVLVRRHRAGEPGA